MSKKIILIGNYQPEKQDKESLLKVLSKGEQRAFFILQLLFEIKYQ